MLLLLPLLSLSLLPSLPSASAPPLPHTLIHIEDPEQNSRIHEFKYDWSKPLAYSAARFVESASSGSLLPHQDADFFVRTIADAIAEPLTVQFADGTSVTLSAFQDKEAEPTAAAIAQALAAQHSLPPDSQAAALLRAWLLSQARSVWVRRPYTVSVSAAPRGAALSDSVVTADVRQSDAEFLLKATDADPYLDRVTDHIYEHVYGKYLWPLRDKPFRLLEIGLGCGGMPSGIGAGARFWRQNFPLVEIFEADYDVICALEWEREHGARLGVRVLLGDQSNREDLLRWIEEAGGPFDVIIDDGGHSNEQQLTSLSVLFHQGLKPGGFYVMEDMMFAHKDPLGQGYGHWRAPTALAAIAEALATHMESGWPIPPEVTERLAFNAPPLGGIQSVKSIDFFSEAAVLVKCATGERCRPPL